MRTRLGVVLASVLLLLAAALMVPAPAAAAGGAVFTTSAHFDLGTEVGVNHTETPDQLQLNLQQSTFPFIWVANSDDGTVSKLDTNTGTELARYRSAPDGIGRNPSRTTVDQDGNVWVGNRNSNTITKIGLLEAGNCVDRNGNGVIETSTGGTDVKAWPSSGPADECILMNVVLGTATGNNNNVRAVAIDADNNVFAGMSAGSNVYHVNGATGAVIQTFTQPFGGNYPSYGAVVDPNGNLWIAADGNNAVVKHTFHADGTHDAVQTISLPGWGYGMGIASDGYLWVSGWTYNNINKIRLSDGVIVNTHSLSAYGGSGLRGVAVTADGDIWVASSYGNSVIRIHPDGAHVATIGVGSHPTGVAVDDNGKVWVTNYWSHNVSRIDPATNTVDGTFPVGAGPYNYSDMTGMIIRNITTNQGTWTAIQDGGTAGMAWGKVKWTSVEPTGTEVTARVRVADSTAGLGAAPWVSVTNGATLTGVAGRYLQVEVRLSTTVEGVTPIVEDVTLEPAATAGLNFLDPLDNNEPTTVDDPFDILFTWVAPAGGPAPDTSVSIRVRKAATNQLVTGYTYGAGITYDPATGVYSQHFDWQQLGVAPGTQLKIMVYFGGKLKGTALVTVQ